MLGLERLLVGVGTVGVQPLADFGKLGLDLSALGVGGSGNEALLLEKVPRTVGVSLEFVERGLAGDTGPVRSVESDQAIILSENHFNNH